MIYKVALAQVHGELRMPRVTGNIGEDGGKPPEPSKMAVLSWAPLGCVLRKGILPVLLEGESGSFPDHSVKSLFRLLSAHSVPFYTSAHQPRVDVCMCVFPCLQGALSQARQLAALPTKGSDKQATAWGTINFS